MDAAYVTDRVPGEDVNLLPLQAVEIEFNKDMVSQDRVGISLTDGPFHWKPAMPGSFRWIHRNRIVFEPEKPWQKATLYVAEMISDLKASDGTPFMGPSLFKMATAPLQLLEIRQVSFDPQGTAWVELLFDDLVLPSEVAQHLIIRDPNDADMSFQLTSHALSKQVKVQISPIRHESYRVMVTSGLVGKSGALGLSSTVEEELNLRMELRLSRITPQFTAGSNLGSIDCEFNTAIDGTKARSYLKIDPPLDMRVESSSHGLRLVGPFQPNRRYRVTFLRGLPARNGTALVEDLHRSVTFEKRPPFLQADAPGYYLSTQGSRLLPVRTMNVKRVQLSVDRIYPNNLVFFADRVGYQQYWYEYESRNLYERVIENKLLMCEGGEDREGQLLLDLGELLGQEASGTYRIRLQDDDSYLSTEKMVLFTDLGLSVKASNQDLLVWVNRILDGTPVPDAEVEVFSRNNQRLCQGKTDSRGIFQWKTKSGWQNQKPYLVTCKKDEDLAYLDLDATGVSTVDFEVQGRPYLQAGFEAFLYTDRGVYRPGETVHLRGCVRGTGCSVAPSFPIEVETLRPDGKRFLLEKHVLNEEGTYEAEMRIPQIARTGLYRTRARLPGAEEILGQVIFQVEEFVSPKIRCDIEMPQGRLSMDHPLEFVVKGNHLFGFPAADHRADATLLFSAVTFSHENWSEYLFPPKELRAMSERTLEEKRLNFEGKASYSHRITLPSHIHPQEVTVVASVHETSGRTVTSRQTRILDPCPFYLGFRGLKSGDFVEVGEPYRVDLAAVLPNGTAASCDRIQVKVHKVNWTRSYKKDPQGRFKWVSEKETLEILSELVDMRDGRGTWSFVPKEEGRFEISITAEGTNFQAGWSVGTGSRWYWSSDSSVQKPGVLRIQRDREIYVPGDTAELSVLSAMEGKALVTVESDHILWHEVVSLEGDPMTLKVPIQEGFPSHVYCSITLLRKHDFPEHEDALPSRAFGVIPLLVDHDVRLNVLVSLPEVIEPLRSLELPVQVHDSRGRGCSAEVAIALVDEGICRLTGFSTPDPFAYFHGPRSLAVQTSDMYGMIIQETRSLGKDSSAAGGEDFEETSRLNPFQSKTFKPVSIWIPSFKVSDSGQGTVLVDVPEFTGELRVMAVAFSGAAAGSFEGNLQVKRDLVVNLGHPRFLAPGDETEITVEVFHLGKEPQEGWIRLETEGPISLMGEKLQKLHLGSEERKVHVFPVRAGKVPGRVDLKVLCRLGQKELETRIELAVRPAAPYLPITGFETLDSRKPLTCTIPGNWVESTARQSLRFSGMPRLQLSGALRYLLQYPYGCLEQTVSSAFPLLYLQDLVEVMDPEAVGGMEIEDKIYQTMDRLWSMQTYSGGFSMWPHQREASAWSSLYATQFLVEARRAGYEVPSWNLDAAFQYAENLLATRPSRHDEDEAELRDVLSTKAYALFVLSQGNKTPLSWLDRLMDEVRWLRPTARCHLGFVLLSEGRREEALELLGDIALPSEGERQTGGTLHSSVREWAIMLSLALDLNPQETDIPILAERISKARERGHWGTTQENAFVIMALGKYCRLLDQERRPFQGEIHIEGKLLGTFNQEEDLNLDFNLSQGPVCDVRVLGEGRAYMVWVSEGVPTDSEILEEDRGIKVRRSFENILSSQDGTLRCGQGDLIKVTLSIESARSLQNVVLQDLLPAGWEVENPRLETVGSREWLASSHLDVRDDRVLIFCDISPTVEPMKLHYFVRAVTPGSYVLPALYADCMYDPGIRSIHGRGRLEVVR